MSSCPRLLLILCYALRANKMELFLFSRAYVIILLLPPNESGIYFELMLPLPSGTAVLAVTAQGNNSIVK